MQGISPFSTVFEDLKYLKESFGGGIEGCKKEHKAGEIA